MTTYVLHGGKTSIDNIQNDLFFKQFTELVTKNQLLILMCYWARPRNEWEALLNRDTTKILKHTHKNVVFDLVNDPKELYFKLSSADVLYVAGGDAPPIERYYGELTNLKKALDGKVYLGSSMGAFLAAKSYVLSFDEQESDSVHEGVGLLPLNVLVHWDKEQKKQEKMRLLQAHATHTPIITIDEFQFVTFVF